MIMLAKHACITRIIETGIVAVLRSFPSERSKKIAQACLNGGVSIIEFAFTFDNAAECIREISTEFRDTCIVGAGTVLDAETARIAILAGAAYIVSPTFDKATALLCNRYGVPYMAGCSTPTEALRAMEYGVDIIKLFPASVLTPSALRALKGPFPHINIMPTGGITVDNAKKWMEAGAIALGISGDLMKGALTGDFDLIKEKAARYKAIVAEVRGNG